MRIGIFDSGVGGITVLHEALSQLPHEDFIYYADTAHVPYGTKSKAEVREYIFEAAGFLARQGIKALVVACNTATSVAIADLRETYSFPILGMEPAVKPAIEKNGHKRVLVTATTLTLQEEKYQNLVARLDQAHMVDALALPELVEYAENFVFDRGILIPFLRHKLDAYDLTQYGTVVLGCTHFPFFKECFRELFPQDTSIIDGNKGTVNYLKKVLTEKNLLSVSGTGDIRYYSSGTEEGPACRYHDYLQFLKEVAIPRQ